jgi:diguanylate cyclase (GGDEF)-like protein
VPNLGGDLLGNRAAPVPPAGRGSEDGVTLRARLTAAFLAVVLGPVLIGAVFVGITVSEVSNRRAVERLQVATTTVRTTVDAACHELRSAAQIAARLYGGGSAADQASAARDGVATRLATAVQITDEHGTIRSTAGQLIGPSADCASAYPAGTERPHSLVARVRLTDQSGRSIGEVVAGVPVDRSFVSHLGASTGVDVTLLSAGDPLSTETAVRADAIAGTAHGLRGDQVKPTHDGVFVRLAPAGTEQPLRLALSTTRSDSQTLYAVLIGVVVLAGLVAVGAAWWLADSTTRPLAELAGAADRVAGGDLAARVPVRSRDEVGQLASTFNRMTREMQAYVQALTASRDQLRGNLGMLGDTLSNTHDLDGILSVILETAMAATGAQSGVVLLVDGPDGMHPNQLVARCADGFDGRISSLSSIHVALGEGLLGGVAQGGEPRRGRADGIVLAPTEPRCRTYIAVPFSGSARPGPTGGGDNGDGEHGQLRGVLALYDRLGQDDFDDADLGTLRTFAGQAAVAVDNVLLHQETERLSLTDPLTELWNYRYLRVALSNEVERATRFDRRLSVLAMDLDRFKEVNDTYGHSAGDAVLVAFAQRIRAEIREIDLACRQGGEEFVVLLPETDRAGAAHLAERICAAVRELRVPIAAPDGREPWEIQVTVSVGVAVYPDHGGTGQDVLDAADDALYAAKAAGRDTWRLAAGPPRRRPGRTGPATAVSPADDAPAGADQPPAGTGPDGSGTRAGGAPAAEAAAGEGAADRPGGASHRPRTPRQTRGG